MEEDKNMAAAKKATKKSTRYVTIAFVIFVLMTCFTYYDNWRTRKIKTSIIESNQEMIDVTTEVGKELKHYNVILDSLLAPSDTLGE